MKTLVCALGLFLASANLAGAQTTKNITFPGSVWTTNGTLTPAEAGNISSLSHIEQGMVFRKTAEVFLQGTLGLDTKSYDWNNKTVGGVGVRLSRTIGSGIVRGGVAYLTDHRRLSGKTYSGISVFVDSYFQWSK
jgi:hypothetical protein